LVSSQKEKLKQMATETSNIEEQIDQTRRLIKQREDFEKTHETLREALDKREDGMAYGDRYFWFVNMLNKFKSNYQVDIPQISPATVGPVGVFPEFPYEAATFKVSGTAHFYEFGKFLKDFENAFPYIRVQNLDIDPSGGAASGSEKISFRMDVVTLVKPANS
ncbi:MAG TPA: hypothetical protein DCY13_15640, partial [Verrucomicrobiales bacterium]|nr:hypothetical protein [Verrucomicrobiales bacterium]